MAHSRPVAADRLQRTLASMPLKDMAHRSGDATRAAPQRPRPRHRPSQAGAEFLTTFTITIPDATPRQAIEDAEAGEAARAHELAGQGNLERLWILPGQGRALGVYRARDRAEMEAIVKSLPLDPWMTTELTPLMPDPSDPATTST